MPNEQERNMHMNKKLKTKAELKRLNKEFSEPVKCTGNNCATARPAKMKDLDPMRKLILLITLITPRLCLAQPYSIDWNKVSGGGGTSSGGQYAVSGTVGQQDAGGPMTGGNYAVTGGFWSLISVVQTPGAPLLYISRNGSNVTIFWQNVPGWTLLQNNNLASPANWSPSSGVTTSNGTNYLNQASPAGTFFFRLKQQ
jgi:hypothetical protein